MYIQMRAALALSAVFFWMLHVQVDGTRMVIQIEDGAEVTAADKCEQLRLLALAAELDAWCEGDVE